MKRTTNDTMKRTTKLRMIAVGVAFALAVAPGSAFADSDDLLVAATDFENVGAEAAEGSEGVTSASSDLLAALEQEIAEQALDAEEAESASENVVEHTIAHASRAMQAMTAAVQSAQAAEAEKTDKLLTYDPADIAAIGTQEQTGHTICCPSFSCAYADAVLDGTVHDHGYYTCSCCTWTDWGGGESSYRYVGTSEELLREAYDQIASGRPTVIHVAAGYGEHWIALIGYTGATDPDHLTLANFIALDPWDGAQIVASDRFVLYGDGCEHVSER